ncbi:MAG: hypothetical protein C0615_07865, partial [Desulfuromonas sp.]
MSGREIMRALDLPAGARKGLFRQLRQLQKQGVLIRQRGGRFALAQREFETREGTLALTRRGDGLIDEGRHPVRIAARFLAGALDGDRVRYVVIGRGRFNRLNGKVTGIVERSRKLIVGSYQQGRDHDFILPVDASFSRPIPVYYSGGIRPEAGEWVAVKFS